MIFEKNKIMKKSILCITLLIVTILQAQTKEEITLENGSKFLVGQISIEDLKAEPYKDWYETNFSTYKTEAYKVNSFANELKNHNLLLFMGTWCGDSKREVPRIIKMLEDANFPLNQLKIVGVDRRKQFYKKSPGGEEWGLDIRKVPTLIFLKNGREVNRIVESPIVSLEVDFATILGSKKYIPNHSSSGK